VAARGDVRRAKLYYLRGRVGKRARVRERRSAGPEIAVERELLYGPEGESGAQDQAGSQEDAVPEPSQDASPEPAAPTEPAGDDQV
jgi:large subunit ribosomal protein L19